MTNDTEFRNVYSLVAGALGMEPVDSADFLRLLNEWQQAGRDADILDFLYRHAKTTEMPIVDPQG